jgi:hypothetical protein
LKANWSSAPSGIESEWPGLFWTTTKMLQKYKNSKIQKIILTSKENRLLWSKLRFDKKYHNMALIFPILFPLNNMLFWKSIDTINIFGVAKKKEIIFKNI